MKTVFENGFMKAELNDDGMFTFDRKKTQHGSIVVAIDTHGQFILTSEMRAGVDVPVIGVVKGAADNDTETYQAIAERELLEELGIKADHIIVSQIEPFALPAFTSTRGRVCMAIDCRKVGDQKLEHGEDIEEFGRFSEEQIRKMIANGTINDCESACALMSVIMLR